MIQLLAAARIEYIMIALLALQTREEVAVSSVLRRMQLVGLCFVLFAVTADAGTRVVVFEGFYRVT